MTIKKIKASELMENNYTEYGHYVNTTRAVPGVDGLKYVQRRMLLAVRDIAQKNWARSATVVGRCLAYHPHGEHYESLVGLVNSGFVLGHGNFGSNMLVPQPPAAMRYTSVKAHPHFSESVFRLIPHVPHFVDFGDPEPTYMPVPVPLCLTTGTLGIGVGLIFSCPMFHLKSLVEARKKDDPELLRPPVGVASVSGDLKQLWERGFGFLQYGLQCYRDWSSLDKKSVSVIEGSTIAFTPSIMSKFRDLENEGLVYIRDESTDHLRVVISRVKKLRRVTDEVVHQMAEQTAKRSRYFRLYASIDNCVHTISARTWLNLSWDRFSDAVGEWKKDSIERIEHQIVIYTIIPKVADMLKKNKTTKQIATDLGKDEGMIAEIEGKPMRMLRKKDHNEKINQLKKSLQDTKKVTADSVCDGFVKSISGGNDGAAQNQIPG